MDWCLDRRKYRHDLGPTLHYLLVWLKLIYRIYRLAANLRDLDMFHRDDRIRYRWVPVGLSQPRLASRPEIARQLDEGSSLFAAGRYRVAFQPMSLNAAVRIYGLSVSGASPENELVDLLRTAAEIEHGLMLQYLYAMYSATNPIIAGISVKSLSRRWVISFVCRTSCCRAGRRRI